MRDPARTAFKAVVLAFVLALFIVPASVYAADPSEATAVPVADELVVPETQASADASEAAPADASDETSETAEVVPTVETAVESAGATMSSQATADTRRAVEALLKTRKKQFDTVTAELQRSIDQLSVIMRKLDAAGANVTTARARIAEARSALDRARALERVTVARYRAVLTAEDERAAYDRAKAAARVSSAQLERARVKVITATRTLRAIVKNVTVQNVGASTDST